MCSCRVKWGVTLTAEGAEGVERGRASREYCEKVGGFTTEDTEDAEGGEKNVRKS